ncbi:MAG: prepilin-type N-terminal cleavage/methylation domain-containing protein [Dethiobacteria bacterium]
MGIIRKIVLGEKGFTLVELMVVLAIMAILATVAVVAFRGRIDDARQSVEKANIAIIQGAVDLYYHDHNEYPEKLEDLYDQSRGEPYLRTSLEDLKADGVEYRICPHSGKVTAAKIKEGQ